MFNLNNISPQNFSWLYDLSTPKWNLVLSGLHLTTAIFIFFQWYLPDFWEVHSDVKINVFEHQYDLNNNIVRETGVVPVFLLIWIFEFITSLFHFFYFLTGRLSGNFRYLEYSLSAPIMIVILALLLGLQEIFILVLLAFLTHITMVFGYIQDLKAPDKNIFYLAIIYDILAFALYVTYLALNKFDFSLQFVANFCFLRVQVDNSTNGMNFDVVVEQQDSQIALTVVLLVAASIFTAAVFFNVQLLKYVAISMFAFVALAASGVVEAYFLSLFLTTIITIGVLYSIKDWDPQYQTLSKVEVYKPYLLGFIPFLATWAVLLTYYAVSVIINDAKPPWFVHVVVIFEFVLFSSFVLPQYFFGGDDQQNEKDGLFNLLSLTSKLLLSWLLYGGIKGASAS